MANTIINGGASPYPKTVGPSPIASFSDGADNAPLKSLIFGIEPQQDLHGYANPWPGGGGANKWDEEWELGSYNSSGQPSSSSTSIRCKNFIPVTPGQTYLYYNGTGSSQAPWLYDENKNFLRRHGSYMTSGATITIPNDVYYIKFALPGTYGATYKNDVAWNYPATVTTYSPYSNISPISGTSQVDGKQSGADTSDYTSITISLGQTVYGGTVDVIRGKLVVDRISTDLDTLTSGWTTVTQSGLQCVRRRVADILNGTGNVYTLMTSHFKVLTSSDNLADGTAINMGGNYYNLTLCAPSLFTDQATLLTWANAQKQNGTPVQLSWKLATPLEYDLTPVTGLTSLLGQNNIWHSAGETTVEYYPAAASIIAVQSRTSKAYVSIPLGKIRYDTYQITPAQAIDLDSYRSESGTLIRNVVGSKAKIEFNTVMMNSNEWAEVWKILSAGFNNANERKLKLKYFDTQSGTYKYGTFYIPDVQTPIRNVSEASGIINYNEIRIAFIEY